MNRKDIARDTLRILDNGFYRNSAGVEVSIAALVDGCVAETIYHEPEGLAALVTQVMDGTIARDECTREVHNETTLQGARVLAKSDKHRRVGVLNFASAKNPGGGFQGGAQAQEESLARSSALYGSLVACPDFYKHHRAQESCLYTDRMIYSPACPVFRDDNGALLDAPYCVDFLTSPAPNAGVVRQRDENESARIEEVLYGRCGKLLALFASNGCDALVLGAWGCGVFRNDPVMVAEMFRHYLGPGGVYARLFEHVRFSVLSRGRDASIIDAFSGSFVEKASVQ